MRVCGFIVTSCCVSLLLSPRTLTSIEDSDVYQMLQKEQEEPQVPRQSGSFKALQEFIDSDGELFPFFLHKNILEVEMITGTDSQKCRNRCFKGPESFSEAALYSEL